MGLPSLAPLARVLYDACRDAGLWRAGWDPNPRLPGQESETLAPSQRLEGFNGRERG